MRTKEAENELTPRQVQLLRLIQRFQEGNFYLPTIGELAREVGISRSTTFEHIDQLRRKGYLGSGAGKARCLRLTSKSLRLIRHFAQRSEETSPEQADGLELAGRVAAGVPIEAIENKESLSLRGLFGSDEVFALEVRGESMNGEGISDGDYVICKKASVADDGQLVVAIVDGENATLKRFYKEKGAIRLQPANEKYEPIYSRDCRIEAVVLGLVKRF